LFETVIFTVKFSRMKLTKITLLLSLTGLIYVNSGCNSQQKDAVTLAFNLQKGKTYDYSMDYDMEQEVQGQEINTKLKGSYDIGVTEDDGKVKTLKVTYNRIAMNVAMPGTNMEIDSEKADTSNKGEINDPGQLMNSMFGALKGKSFFMKVDKEGQVLEVTGLDDIAQAMIGSMNIKEEMKPMAQQAFAQQFNEQSIKDMFSQSFNIFPNKEIKVGDTWEKSISGTAAMPISMKTTYTVKSIDGNTVTLNSDSNLDLGADSQMTGNQTGTLKVNAKTGLVEDASFEQKITGQMSMTTKGRITGKEK